MGKLFDVLSLDHEGAILDRNTATFVLRSWISRSPERGHLLYSERDRTGLLLAGRRFTPVEAELILTLLHDFSREERSRKETFDLLVLQLNNHKLAIRQLAFWHLIRLAQGIPADKLPKYEPAWPQPRREAAVKEWEKLLETGELPPRLKGKQ